MNRKFFILLFFVVLFLLSLNFGVSPSSDLLPSMCEDSDGDCDFARINESDGVYEMVDLLTYPFGWIVASNFIYNIPEQNTIDSAYIHVLWFSDVGEGASNINIDYWNGTDWINCAGPFEENGSLSESVCDVSHLTKQQILNIKVRLRGEDLDGFPMAFVYVDSIKIEVNHSAPPQWKNQVTNTTNDLIFTKGSIQLATQVFDDVGLAYAWLSTNETGEWKNYTDGTYGSPIYLNNQAGTWTWANFSWKNDSVISGTVAWKVFINDTTGKENVTQEKTFYIQFRRLPSMCEDSDGDCDFARINESDGVYEMVDLLTYPFGWISISGWEPEMPENIVINSAYIHVLWFSDVGEGASNINIDYWNGTDWINCAGPFEENGSLSESVCDVSHLTKQQILNIKVRLRGEDLDGFPMAFVYVDQVYVAINYTTGIPYIEVELVLPKPQFLTNIIQNSTFIVNATVFCRNADCGNVYGTLMYNSTSLYPDTPLNTTYGDKPFFIQEAPASALKACPNNPLRAEDFCNLTWIVNASGEINSGWKIGVYFNSSYPQIQPNFTANATLSIVSCTVDFSLSWSFIEFDELVPNTYNNPAPGNSNNLYNITVNPGSCNLDFYIRGSDLVNSNLGFIKVGNLSWSNISSNLQDGYFQLSETNSLIRANVPERTNVTTWYWLSVPPVPAGVYSGKIYITGVKHE